MHMLTMANLSNSYIATITAGTIQMIVKSTPYFGRKLKVNVTEAKVGIKSCRFY